MWSKLTVLLALLGALTPALARSSGCGKSPPSSGTKTVTINGKQRQYTLQVPQNYNSNTAYKFVIAYHWLNGNMGAVVNGQYYGLLPLSAGTTIFVAPNGLNAGWANQNGEDIAFTDAILQSVKDSLCVDESNIFATGWSYGGSMSFSAACSRPSKCVCELLGGQWLGGLALLDWDREVEAAGDDGEGAGDAGVGVGGEGVGDGRAESAGVVVCESEGGEDAGAVEVEEVAGEADEEDYSGSGFWGGIRVTRRNPICSTRIPVTKTNALITSTTLPLIRRLQGRSGHLRRPTQWLQRRHNPGPLLRNSRHSRRRPQHLPWPPTP